MDKFLVIVSVTVILSTLSQHLNAAPSRSCNCVCGVRGRSDRIVGGREAAPHSFPWLAGLYTQEKLYCGATVITPKHLLTAAHCVDGIESSEIRVLLGGHNLTSDFTETRRVRRIHQHENFDIFTFNNDIAIVEVDRPIKYGPTVQPACLPDPSVTDYTGALTIIAGWGRIAEKQETSTVLRSVVVPVWSMEQCREAGYGRKRITNNMMCAGYHDGRRDACQGDSGGAMNREGSSGSMEVIGVVSWGRGCARPNLPGIYTKVSNYLPWIRKQLKSTCVCRPRKGTRNDVVESMADVEDY